MLSLPKIMKIIDDNYNYYYALVVDAVKSNHKNAIDGYNAFIFIKAENLGAVNAKSLSFSGNISKPSLFNSRTKSTYSKYEVFFTPQSITEVYSVGLNSKNLNYEEIIEETENFLKYLGLGKIKPFDLRVSDKHLVTEYASWKSLQDTVFNSKCFNCEFREKHVFSLGNQSFLTEKVKTAEAKIKECEIVFGFQETEKMIQVLRELNFINENNIPQLKTRVARELGGGVENLYITELLMKNVLDKLEPEEIVPVISVFVAQARSRDEFDLDSLDVPDNLMEALNQCHDICSVIKDAESKQEIEGSLEPNFLLVKPLYEWAKGRDFVDITEYTEVLEGAIVRTIQRVEQTLRNIKRALTVIGNDTQLQKVDKAMVVIKRDIAFSLSLYIDENKEIIG